MRHTGGIEGKCEFHTGSRIPCHSLQYSDNLMSLREILERKLTEELEGAIDRFRNAGNNPLARETARRELSEVLARFDKYVLRGEVPDDLS